MKFLILRPTLLVTCFCLGVMFASAQVGIGISTPAGSAMLDVQSTAKGILVPRMSTTQRTAIVSPATGVLVFDNSLNQFFYYNGTGWTGLFADNLGNHTATQNIALNGNKLVNGVGSTNGINIDAAGNTNVTGRISAPTATFSAIGGADGDHIIRTAAGNLATRKGFGALSLNYIIAIEGIFPTPDGYTGGNNFIGEIRMFAGNYAPGGWMLCSGQLLNVSEYSALFTILGTTYGGDGVNTFGLPDLRGAVPVHQGTIGTSNWNLGERVY